MFADILDHGILPGQWFLREAKVPVAESWLTKLEPEIAPGTLVVAWDDGTRLTHYGPFFQLMTGRWDHVRPVLCLACGAAVRVKERPDEGGKQ
jgi:hypothetical protein